MNVTVGSSPYEIAFYPSIRQENYTFGLNNASYPHAYFLEKLLRVVDIENAKRFLDDFNDPMIYQILHFDQYNYICRYKEIVEQEEKAALIIKEAESLRKMVEQAKEIQKVKKVLERKVVKDKKNEPDSFSDSYIINLASAELTITDKMSEIIAQSKQRLTGITLEPTIDTRKIKQRIVTKVNTVKLVNGREEYNHSHPEIDTVEMNTTFEISYRYITHDFLAIPWLELLEMLRNNIPINECKTCGNYYFNALNPETSKYCEVCGPPSRRSGEKPNQTRTNIVSYIQRGYLSFEEGQKQLKELGYKEYKPRKKAKRKNKTKGGS